MPVALFKRLHVVLLIGLLLILVGCGQNNTKISGVAGASFLENSTVEILEPEFGTAVASGVTDEQGRFTVLVPNGGPYLVKISKGVERVIAEDGSVTNNTMNDSAALYGILITTDDAPEVTVSPATTLVFWTAVGKASTHAKYITKEDMLSAFELIGKHAQTDLSTAPLLYKSDMSKTQKESFLQYKMYNMLLEESSGAGVLVTDKTFTAYLAALGLQYGLTGKINKDAVPSNFIPNQIFVNTVLEKNGIGKTDEVSPLNNIAFSRYVSSFQNEIDLHATDDVRRKTFVARVVNVTEHEIKTYKNSSQKFFTDSEHEKLEEGVEKVVNAALKAVPLRLEGLATPNVLKAGSPSKSTLEYRLRMSDSTAQIPAKSLMKVTVPTITGVSVAEETPAPNGRYLLAYDGRMLTQQVTPVKVIASYLDPVGVFDNEITVNISRAEISVPKVTLQIKNDLNGKLLADGRAELDLVLNLDSHSDLVDWPVTFSVDQGEISLASDNIYASSQTLDAKAGTNEITLKFRVRDNESALTKIMLTATVKGEKETDSKPVGVDNGSSL